MPYVTINTKVQKIVRGVPGPPGDPTQPFESIKMDTTTGEPAIPIQGEMWWDIEEETYSLKQDGATLQIGQEVQWPVSNKTGSTILDGTAVMAVGTVGATGRILIAPMDGITPANAKFLLGVATHDIGNNEQGKVTAFGKVRDMDTTGTAEGETWADEDILWISDSVAGQLTNIQPDRDSIGMPVAFVINSNANVGVLSIRITPINEHLLVTEDQRDALDNANLPTASNPVATITDVLDNDALLYMMRVIADGGTVEDPVFLDSFFKDAKANNYFDDIVAAYSPSWGVKGTTNASNLYSITGTGSDIEQTVGASQPAISTADLNGKTRLTFDGVDDAFTPKLFTFNQPETITLGALEYTSHVNGVRFFDGGVTNGATLRNAFTSGNIQAFAGASLIASPLVVGTNSHIRTLYNGSSSALQVDGNTEVTGDLGAANAQGLTLGSSAVPNNYANFKVGMVVLLNSAIDGNYAAKMTAIYNFSKSAYGTA